MNVEGGKCIRNLLVMWPASSHISIKWYPRCYCLNSIPTISSQPEVTPHTSLVFRLHGIIILGRPPDPSECTPGCLPSHEPNNLNNQYSIQGRGNGKLSWNNQGSTSLFIKTSGTEMCFPDSKQEEDREHPFCLFLSLLCTRKSPRARGHEVGKTCFESSQPFLS